MRPLLRAGFRVLSAVAPPLAASLGARIWFRIPKPRIREGTREFLATGDRFTVTVHGRRVAGWRWGAGPTVLFMHGWGGIGAQFQSMIRAIVPLGFRAVTFDALTHGESDHGPMGGRRSTVLEMAEALREVSRTTPDLAAVVAHSGGAAATAWAMSKEPSWRIPRLVFVAPFARPLRFIDVFQRELGLSDRAIGIFRRNAERDLSFRWVDLEVPEMADRMPTPPTLVIHDREDRETSWQDGADIAASWPSARLISTSGLGHNRILHDPAVVAAVVEFLKE